jgi:predicted phosphodiesterase
MILNPGSISLPRQSDMNRTYAVLEIDDTEVKVTHKKYQA